MFKYVVFFAIISSVFGCMPTGKKNHVTIGSDTYVCITLGPLDWNNTGSYLQIAATLQADKLSSVKVPQSWTSSEYGNDTALTMLGIVDQQLVGAGMGVSVSSMGVLSFQRAYRQVLQTSLPTPQPSSPPTVEPTEAPFTLSAQPSLRSTLAPSEAPSAAPFLSPSPVQSSGAFKTNAPSAAPTATPSAEPTTSLRPTEEPTATPTRDPTVSVGPSAAPTTLPSAAPTAAPSPTPSTAAAPTPFPSALPSLAPTAAPSARPSAAPTALPTAPPTATPSALSSAIPTAAPTESPSAAPVVRRLQATEEEEAAVSGDGELSGLRQLTGLYGTKSVTFPMLMVIISVDKGRVKSVVWDDFCNWCGASHCAANTLDYHQGEVGGEGGNCYVDDSSCERSPQSTSRNTTTSTTNLCELNVYITWHGTDSSGAHFQSAASRFSRMDSFQIQNFTSTLQSERPPQ